MPFVNRREELAFLRERSGGDRFEFVPIYGRRRVGKTRLVQEFLRGIPGMYFMADTVAEQEQLRSIGREVGERFGDTILFESGFKDWPQLFRYLEQRVRSRFVLAIDEFPYLVSANRAISSIFQKAIDTTLAHTPLFLVLTGSSIGMMEREVLWSGAPLYGRRTGSLEVREMGFCSLREFFPKARFPALAEIYATAGTMPAYVERFDPRRPIRSNISGLVLERGAFLANEPEFLLRQELREPRDYFVILRSISQGKRKISEIINDTGFEKSHLSRYLDTLLSLGLTERETPVTERRPDKSRNGLHRIKDRFLAFWFKYVLPHRGRLEFGDRESVLSRIEESWTSHMADAYEEIARELCRAWAREGRMTFDVIGRWWSRTDEIDLVALDESERTIHLGECKWTEDRVGEGVLDELRRKAAHVDWNVGRREERFMLFSRSGFAPSLIRRARREGVLLVEGDEPL